MKYKCIEDLQGTGWCVGEIDTIEGWRERAIEWADSDENEDASEALYVLKPEKVIPFISDIWQLVFEKVTF